jgi:hypothetical protein
MKTGPARVLIIRHAEKPGDPFDDQPSDGPDLSDVGKVRAEMLAAYIPAEFGRPDYIFAARTSSISSRPVETVTPLAVSLGVPIESDFADRDVEIVAGEILKSRKYRGSKVLVCWHHRYIPGLAAALGVHHEPIPWPGNMFDRVWMIDYSTEAPTFSVWQQRLLPGDSMGTSPEVMRSLKDMSWPPSPPKPRSRALEWERQRTIRATTHRVDGHPTQAYEAGETYKLRCSVGTPVSGNLAKGDTAVNNVPQSGVNTHWVVTSTDLTFVAMPDTASVERIGNTWTGQFDLFIPERGNSESKDLAFLAGPRAGTIHVTIYAVAFDESREIYRELSVQLEGALKVTEDATTKAMLHTHLGTTHGWTTPPEHIQVTINNGVALVSTKRIRLESHEFPEPFSGDSTRLKGPIENVREALEKFRVAHDAYLNDLDHWDIAARLKSGRWRPDCCHKDGWAPLPDEADQPQSDAFDQVIRSREWRELAHAGYTLFDCCFEERSKLRALLSTKLSAGSRVDFHWIHGRDAVPHVPWALMYTEPVDVLDRTLANPERFLGLRFRLSSHSWLVENSSVVLGDLDSTHSVNLLYWGDKRGDEVAAQAAWQSAQYSQLNRVHVLPDRHQPDYKRQIMSAIDSPTPSPVGILYLFCHCSVGNGATPCLRFGNSMSQDDIIERGEIGLTKLKDGPLIFANACATAQADPNMTSDLEDSFFRRGVRAFIGTETKVPIKLASKFAWLYFQYLYRLADPQQAPMSAGEALTQARMFLWTQYKNIGGLFYCLTNQYDLYLASEDEVLRLRK